ncbi:MAG: tRNA-(ms[2]io[6]A)-hydroxylase [Myxococcota bacterium]|nr:tRNA-(ms[2]io[6]A)-hydroxylase [Myxococcota bacterium]
MLELHTRSSDEWIAAVLGNFDAFLLDHAACEKKASAMALTFVARYPDREAIIDPMIQLAREELTHFHRVYKLMSARGLRFQADEKDPYLKALIPQTRQGRDPEFMDRLLMAAVVEARGCERFGLLAKALNDPELHEFYDEIARSESRHASLFTDLAAVYFPTDEIQDRLEFWLKQEAIAIASIPPRPALH